METKLACYGSRRNVVRSTEGGEKVIECVIVGEIDERNLSTPLVTIALEQIVITNRQIEQVTRSNSWWIVIVVLGTWRRHLKQGRTKL